jgi:hypothetical protein
METTTHQSVIVTKEERSVTGCLWCGVVTLQVLAIPDGLLWYHLDVKNWVESMQLIIVRTWENFDLSVDEILLIYGIWGGNWARAPAGRGPVQPGLEIRPRMVHQWPPCRQAIPQRHHQSSDGCKSSSTTTTLEAAGDQAWCRGRAAAGKQVAKSMRMQCLVSTWVHDGKYIQIQKGPV